MLSDLTTFKKPLWIKSEGLVWVPVSWFLLSDTLIQKLWHAIVSLLRVEVLAGGLRVLTQLTNLTRVLVELFVVS